MIIVSCRKNFWDNEEFAEDWQKQIKDHNSNEGGNIGDLGVCAVGI